MVIDPWVLDEELSRWEDLTGEKPEGERLFISERASVILPFHKYYDSADKVVGTTGRGIGPAYRDRIERVGLRFTDIEEVLSDSRIIEETVLRMNKQLKTVGYDKEIQPGELSSQLQWILDRFGSAIKPTGLMVDLALRNGETVLLEERKEHCLTLTKDLSVCHIKCSRKGKCNPWCRNSSRSCNKVLWNYKAYYKS